MDNQKHIILFDLDGTLLNVWERLYDIHIDLAKKYRFTPMETRKYVRLKRGGMGERDILMRMPLPLKTVDDYLHSRSECIEERKYLQRDTLKIGVRNILESLLTSYRLIAVTKRKNGKGCLDQMHSLRVARYFDDIITMASGNKADGIRQRLGSVDIKKSLVIGDTEEDAQAADQLGIRCILLCDGLRSRIFLSRLPHALLVNHLSDIIAKLRRPPDE